MTITNQILRLGHGQLLGQIDSFVTFTYATSGKAAASSSNCNSLANCSLITSDKEQDIVFWRGSPWILFKKKKKAIQNNEIKVTSKT